MRACRRSVRIEYLPSESNPLGVNKTDAAVLAAKSGLYERMRHIDRHTWCASVSAGSRAAASSGSDNKQPKNDRVKTS